MPNVPFFNTPGESYQRHNGTSLGIEGDTQLLYEEICRSGGSAISHTPATNMGADWSDYDPELEPVVEIFQGGRYNYECATCPLIDTAENHPSSTSALLETIRPKGFVSEAWVNGYRLGVIAGSDHLSTHMSYAVVYAEDTSREAIVAGLKARHAYAATDNIIVDFWMGGHFMGAEFEAPETPPISDRIIATNPIKTLSLIRNNTAIYSSSSGDIEAVLRYQDRDAPSGRNFYYVRALQQDNQIAWSSPLWITIP